MIWAVMWFWLFGIFTVADVITTEIGLACGFYEGNPIARPFLDNIVEVKIILLVLAIVMVLVYNRIRDGDGWVPLALSTTWTAAIVIQNIIRIAGISI